MLRAVPDSYERRRPEIQGTIFRMNHPTRNVVARTVQLVTQRSDVSPPVQWRSSVLRRDGVSEQHVGARWGRYSERVSLD